MYNSSKHVWPEFLPFGTLLVQTLVWVQWRVAVVFRYNSWYKTAQIWNYFFKHLIKHKHTGESWYSTSQWTFNPNCIGEKFQMCLGSQLYKCMNLHSSKKHHIVYDLSLHSLNLIYRWIRVDHKASYIYSVAVWNMSFSLEFQGLIVFNQNEENVILEPRAFINSTY